MDFRLITILKRFEKQFNLNEGLIRSHSIESVLSVFSRKGYKVSKQDNKVRISWNNDSNHSDVLALINNLGWFPVKMSYSTKITNAPYNEKIFKKYCEVGNVLLTLELEPKFDVEVENYPQYLYHISEFRYWPKIELKGLIPKSFNKLTPHPDRIYLSVSKDESLKLFGKLSKFSNQNEFVLLKIDTTTIPQYFKLYNDPNFDKKGLYTINNIPPYSLELVQKLEK